MQTRMDQAGLLQACELGLKLFCFYVDYIVGVGSILWFFLPAKTFHEGLGIFKLPKRGEGTVLMKLLGCCTLGVFIFALAGDVEEHAKLWVGLIPLWLLVLVAQVLGILLGKMNCNLFCFLLVSKSFPAQPCFLKHLGQGDVVRILAIVSDMLMLHTYLKLLHKLKGVLAQALVHGEEL